MSVQDRLIEGTPKVPVPELNGSRASAIDQRVSASTRPRARRVLAITTNPETGASTRFRVLQWIPYLNEAGFHLSLDAFFSTAEVQVLYQPGRYSSKIVSVISGARRRFQTLRRARETSDVLFIHREFFPLGHRFLMRAVERFPGPVIYDYDDAMFLPQRQGRGVLARLEDLHTPRAIMKRSDLVLAGNEFLAAYARQYARRVVVLPTCIDTQRFVPRTRSRLSGEPLVVGWIGSHTTAKYLQSLGPVLERVAGRVSFRLYVVGSRQPPIIRGVEIEHAQWSLAREVDDFCRCDIGIYPLWDDVWAQGKCAFKAIQFMACGVPVVAAAVGANQQIIWEGVNGYLASTEEEWVEKLTRLLLDPDLREQFGRAGRQTIEERYSLHTQAPTFLTALRDAVNGHE